MNKEIIHWLLEGDVSIQYQVRRDLLRDNKPDLQKQIAKEGWGKQFLANRRANGHWGDDFYQPKWISTHYTLLDLKTLNLDPSNDLVRESIANVISTSKATDGGIMLGPSTEHRSDVCVNAMFLNYASYFQSPENDLKSIVDSILNEIMPDGGFNCRTTRSGAVHSSLHTTISVLEGLLEFSKTGYSYRQKDISQAVTSAEEFILIHQLFRSDKTGGIIHKDFLKLAFPCRWRYDILRALDYFQDAKASWDPRMQGAIDILHQKRNKLGTWNMQAAHPGQVHFKMEQAGKPGRWNTLRVLRVFKHFNQI